MNKKYTVAPLTAAMACAIMVAHAGEVTTTAAEQQKMHVTIYNQNLALIKDRRTISLDKGQSTLVFKDVSAQIRPETAILKGDGVKLLEQNFEYDLLTPQTLLDKYVGKNIRVATRNPSTGDVTEESATVLSNQGGTMLKIGNNIRALDDTMSVIYDNVPDDLRDKPTMTMEIDNHGSVQQDVELTYLSGGLSWKADYIITLVNDKTLDVNGWVTLHNTSGTTFSDAQLQLVAGDVNRVQQSMPRPVMMQAKVAFEKSANTSTDMQEEALFEYHLYSLGHPTTIKNNQQKQVSLLAASDVPYTKKLEVYAHDNYGWRSWGEHADYDDLTASAKIVIDNTKAAQMGMPIPAGIMRTYKKDSAGSTQFIGEDRIKHTPENEHITLTLGESFDVTVKRKQTSFNHALRTEQNAVEKKNKNVITASYEVVFNNAKEQDVVVDYHDNFHSNWSITEQTLKSEKINSTVNRWRVNVPAKGKTVLTYTVTINY